MRTFPTPLQAECLKVITSKTIPAGFSNFWIVNVFAMCFPPATWCTVSFLLLLLSGLEISTNKLWSPVLRPHMRQRKLSEAPSSSKFGAEWLIVPTFSHAEQYVTRQNKTGSETGNFVENFGSGMSTKCFYWSCTETKRVDFYQVNALIQLKRKSSHIFSANSKREQQAMTGIVRS